MSKKRVPDIAFDNSSSDEDDEAPEEISVSASRQQGIDHIKDLQGILKQNKEEAKEKRRQRNEMFRIQKEAKLKNLSKRKLPEDVLAAVSAKAAKGPHNKNAKQSNLNKPGNDDVERTLDQDDDDLPDSGVEDDADVSHSTAGDFIPIGNRHGLVLATPEALAKKKKSATEKVANFKQDRLYNQSAIPRETYKQRRAWKAKQQAMLQK